MNTKRWYISEESTQSEQAIQEAAQYLQQGDLIAFPTETVYGLGADATNEVAVRKIFQAKGRPKDNPLIVHVATLEQLENLVPSIPDYVRSLMRTFSPGPITYILESNGTVAETVTAGLKTIALRIPDHPVALKLLKTVNRPIAAPSANLSGRPSPTTADHVWTDLQGKISGVIDAGETGIGMESTVLYCAGEEPKILRPGGITKEALEKVLQRPVLTADDQSKSASPGVKYRHYQPKVPLWLGPTSAKQFQQVIIKLQAQGNRVGVMARDLLLQKIEADYKISLGQTLGDVANRLYKALRAFDDQSVDLILCETFSEQGLGQAIMNRLQKAAKGTKA